MRGKQRIQIFNIDAENQCNNCIHGRNSDLFLGEMLCDNPIDSHILYPEYGGDKECPFIEIEDPE